ncbi:DNA repair protein REV1 isoform X2 [Ischnura elegans]|uniref:DNA repair protein REV1 isoform X2 n=1 Tax=Ischnura elegans TaxID=197161 RepID=UPI001ED87683|nr:DNA repair protein REV1 isoform X2 [Ischnura elegans]
MRRRRERKIEDEVSYWTLKKAKLAEQFAEINEPGRPSQLFQGVHIYVNGYTVPPAEELKHIIVRHGGVYSVFLDSSVTHMITNNLPDSKMKLLKRVKVVKPEWITDSISEGRQLPCADYFTINPLKEQKMIMQRSCGEGSARVSVGEPSSGGHEQHHDDGESSSVAPVLGADVDSFYNKSRLHFLSTMKMELKNYVSALKKENRQIFPGLEKLKNWLREKYGGDASLGFQRSPDDRLADPPVNVVMHLDMDCYFASVSRCGRPDLEGVPIVVTSSKSVAPQSKNMDSMADIACCSYEARSAGVRNGMRFGRALQICPNLVAVPYEFSKYRTISKNLYEIASSYTDALEAVSCDEMFIDCTMILAEVNCSPLDFAEHIRKEIKDITECSASAGLGGNHVLARLATRKAKPNGMFYVEPAMVEEFMKTVPLRDLPGIGPMLSSKLEELNLHNCAELQTWQLSKLENEFGASTGKRLYNNCRGLDVTRKEGNSDERKSVSSEINYGIRFTKFIEAEETINKISRIVSSKLGELKGKCISLKLKVRSPDAPVMSAKFLGHGICDNICRTTSLDHPTSDPEVIAKTAIDLLRKGNILVSDLRGLGVMVTKLEAPNQKQKTESIAEFFGRMKGKCLPSPKVKEKPPAIQPRLPVRAMVQPHTKWESPVRVRISKESLVLNNAVEEMDFLKLLKNHFESFANTGLAPDKQLKNTLLCIVLSEVSQLNIAPALHALREMNRWCEEIIDTEKKQQWTYLLQSISKKVCKSVSKVIGYSVRNFSVR